MVVETIRGVEFGTVVLGSKEVGPELLVMPLKKVLRQASEADQKIYLAAKSLTSSRKSTRPSAVK